MGRYENIIRRLGTKFRVVTGFNFRSKMVTFFFLPNMLDKVLYGARKLDRMWEDVITF